MRAAVNVLCVCTHNRTRSVMMSALLKRHLDSCDLDATIGAAGFSEIGVPPIDRAVRELASRGIDVAPYRSRAVTASLVAQADLVLTSETDHVIAVASRWPEAFRRTFTLPEFVRRTAAIDTAQTTISELVHCADAGRGTPLDYVDDVSIPEIADPTGRTLLIWRRTVRQIDDLTSSVASVVA